MKRDWRDMQLNSFDELRKIQSFQSKGISSLRGGGGTEIKIQPLRTRFC